MVGNLQHPNQFRDDDQRKESGGVRGERIHHLHRQGRLGGIVVSKIPDNNIRVEANHLNPDARLAMAAFISSIDTGLLSLPWNSPFSSRTERVAATMAN